MPMLIAPDTTPQTSCATAFLRISSACCSIDMAMLFGLRFHDLTVFLPLFGAHFQ